MDFSTTTFWVQVHNLPIDYMNIDNAKCISQQLGLLHKIDLNDKGSITLGKYLRMKVEVEAYAPLKCGFLMDQSPQPDRWFDFRYERLSDFCFHCGRMGHLKTECNFDHPSEVALKWDVGPKGYGSWLQANPIEQKSSRLVEIISSSKASSQDYMARASQNPTQTPDDSFHFRSESPQTMGASSSSSSQPLVSLLNQIIPNNREPPNQSVTIQSEAFTTADIPELGGFIEIPIQATSHVLPNFGIFTNPSDTSHLSSHTSHNPQQTVSSCSSSGSPHLSQNPSFHTELLPIRSLTPYHSSSDAAINLTKAFVCFKMGPSNFIHSSDLGNGPNSSTISNSSWAKINLGCKLADMAQASEVSFGPCGPHSSEVSTGPSGHKSGKRKPEILDYDTEAHPSKKPKEDLNTIKPKPMRRQSTEQRITRNSSIKILARAKGRNLKLEGQRKIGADTGKQVMIEEKLGVVAESPTIQMAEVAGLIMPPPPP
jgi:hypothetical protein